MKIDVFAHILPLKYKEALGKVAPPDIYNKRMNDTLPTLYDLDRRLQIMDRFEELRQVLTISNPPVEAMADPNQAAELAKLANDELAEIIYKYPDRFPAGVACLPMNNMEAALNEADRAINELKFRGVQIATSINGKPLDAPEFLPLYDKMCRYNLPIWVHPFLPSNRSEYPTEKRSKYRTDLIFGWLLETTVAMARLVFSGVLEKYPNLKIITHHAGAMIPLTEYRITNSCDRAELREGDDSKKMLTKPLVEYFKMFYGDTALNGSTAGLMCAYSFFGADHMLFGTDTPFDCQLGEESIRQTIASIERMDIPDVDRRKIYEDNARRMMRLPL